MHAAPPWYYVPDPNPAPAPNPAGESSARRAGSAVDPYVWIYGGDTDLDNDDEADLSYHEYDDEDETSSSDDSLEEVPSWSNPNPNLPSRPKSEAGKANESSAQGMADYRSSPTPSPCTTAGSP